MYDGKVFLEKLCWADVRAGVKNLNPELADSIDRVDPGSDFKIYKYSAPFGAEIMKDGFLQLPSDKGVLAPINSGMINSEIKSDLDYNFDSNPVTFVLKNTIEAYVILNNNTVPLYGLIKPGRLFGTWQILNPKEFHTPTLLWNMTSGARSLFLLSKFSDRVSFTRLKRGYNLSAEKPKSLHDHWQIFKEISCNLKQNESNSWYSEILFFPKKWFENLNDNKWWPFKMYLLETSWKKSEFLRNEFLWDLIFSHIQNERGLRPEPYIADTVRHILAISVGALSGFSPAITDEAGPIQVIKNAMRDVYKLEYEPVIMQPFFLDKKANRSVYYSLDYPTTIRCSPKARNNTSKISELYSIQSLLFKYLNDISSNKFNVSDTPFYNLKKILNYSFFHCDNENLSDIWHPRELEAIDASFSGSDKFPSTSTFLNGCIRISFN